jgi:hypothetical protein
MSGFPFKHKVIMDYTSTSHVDSDENYDVYLAAPKAVSVIYTFNLFLSFIHSIRNKPTRG